MEETDEEKEAWIVKHILPEYRQMYRKLLDLKKFYEDQNVEAKKDGKWKDAVHTFSGGGVSTKCSKHNEGSRT